MGAIALLVFYSNYMVAPLIPAFSREFAVLPMHSARLNTHFPCPEVTFTGGKWLPQNLPNT